MVIYTSYYRYRKIVLVLTYINIINYKLNFKFLVSQTRFLRTTRLFLIISDILISRTTHLFLVIPDMLCPAGQFPPGHLTGYLPGQATLVQTMADLPPVS